MAIWEEDTKIVVLKPNKRRMISLFTNTNSTVDVVELYNRCVNSWKVHGCA